MANYNSVAMGLSVKGSQLLRNIMPEAAFSPAVPIVLTCLSNVCCRSSSQRNLT